jgi:hypothetical protein
MGRSIYLPLTISICALLFIAHGLVILKYAVDVPYMDEWAVLHANALADDLSLSWLYAQHNEHRLALTKLQVWLHYKTDRWNLVYQQLFNFLIYGVLLCWILWMAKEARERLPFWILLSFVPYLLSPIAYENHSMGFQSQVHFSLLFFLISAHLLFHSNQSWARLVIGSLFALLAAYSLSSGLVSSLITLILFWIFKVGKSKRDRLQLITVTVVIGTGLALWLKGYERPNVNPDLVLPYRKEFWTYFLNLISLGFGFEVRTFLPGLLCLLIVLIPIAGLLRNLRDNTSWTTFVSILGLLGVLASIAVGRAGFGTGQSKQSRYAEIGMLVIPFSVLAWSTLLRNRSSLKFKVIALLWTFCFFSFFDNWTWFERYELGAIRRERGRDCIRKYYRGEGEAYCPELYPEPIDQFLKRAKEMNISFTEEMKR